jgi:F0F1-type ATP synthase delta subunit
MSSSLFTTLAETIQTTDDLRTLENELNEIKGSVYSTGKNGLTTVLKERVRMQTAEVIAPALASKPETTLDELISELKKLPILRMRIAFQPTRATIEHFSHWLQQNSDQHWVMDLVIDPELGAGVILEVNGLYRDFSLKEKMDQAVQQATQQIFSQITV